MKRTCKETSHLGKRGSDIGSNNWERRNSWGRGKEEGREEMGEVRWTWEAKPGEVEEDVMLQARMMERRWEREMNTERSTT